MSAPANDRRVALGKGREFDLVRVMLEGSPGGASASEWVRVGPGDDCAVVAGDGIAIGSDLSIEDIHFRREWLSASEIGYRAAAAALSDLAAVAAAPIGILTSIGIPGGESEALVPELAVGIGEACTFAGAALLGGDLSRSPGPLVIDVVVVGRASRPILRDGVRAGDELWVSGRLGGSAAAVRAWQIGAMPDAAAREAYARPRPRIAEALWMAERMEIHAMIDLSDGLAGDAGHLAAASGMEILLEGRSVPIHPSAAGDGLELALGGGEDFELCFAAAPGVVQPLLAEFERTFGVRLSRVGRARAGEGGVLLESTDGGGPLPVGSVIRAAGFDHFGRGGGLP